METRHALIYGSANLAYQSDTMPTPAVMYASVDAAIAALNASNTVASKIDLPGPGADRAVRVSLGATLEGNENVTAKEDFYLVRGANLDGQGGVTLEKAASLLWTASGEAVPTAQGGRSGHKFCKTVSLTATGVLLARVGQECVAISLKPAWVEVYDLCEAVAIIRVMQRPSSSAATTMAPIHLLWR